ncbi:MAG: uracil-DNA glycosylase family protein [Dehalococcoidia bacterium]
MARARGRIDRDARVAAFVRAIAAANPPPPLRNPYRQPVAARNLELFLRRRDPTASTILLVGEAPGHRGAALSGVPFTSLAILLGEGDPWGAFGAAAGYVCPPGVPCTAEATARVVWDGLAEAFGDVDLPLTWNAVPAHPAGPTACSNSNVTVSQIALGRPWLEWILEFAPNARVVAAGRAGERALRGIGVSAPALRHPSHGGARVFRDGLLAVRARRPVSPGGTRDRWRETALAESDRS